MFARHKIRFIDDEIDCSFLRGKIINRIQKLFCTLALRDLDYIDRKKEKNRQTVFRLIEPSQQNVFILIWNLYENEKLKNINWILTKCKFMSFHWTDDDDDDDVLQMIVKSKFRLNTFQLWVWLIVTVKTWESFRH